MSREAGQQTAEYVARADRETKDSEDMKVRSFVNAAKAALYSAGKHKGATRAQLLMLARTAAGTALGRLKCSFF